MGGSVFHLFDVPSGWATECAPSRAGTFLNVQPADSNFAGNAASPVSVPPTRPRSSATAANPTATPTIATPIVTARRRDEASLDVEWRCFGALTLGLSAMSAGEGTSGPCSALVA